MDNPMEHFQPQVRQDTPFRGGIQPYQEGQRLQKVPLSIMKESQSMQDGGRILILYPLMRMEEGQ